MEQKVIGEEEPESVAGKEAAGPLEAQQEGHMHPDSDRHFTIPMLETLPKATARPPSSPRLPDSMTLTLDAGIDKPQSSLSFAG